MQIDINLPENVSQQLDRIERRLGSGPPCPEHLTFWQFAEMRGVTLRTVQRWIAKGKIEAVTTKHGRVIHRDNVSQA